MPYKVFICIKYLEDVLKQLQDMGVRDIAVYDPRLAPAASSPAGSRYCL